MQLTARDIQDDKWRAHIGGAFDTPSMVQLQFFLQGEQKAGHSIFPAKENIFNALNTTPFDKIKVVILGQDPYHGKGQAHGLSFSVPMGVKPPPSLVNIYKEIKNEFGFEIPAHGNLISWAQQGVLLLNATLTVREDSAGSHQKHGWEEFTDTIIHAINDQHNGIVFMLWGAYAQKKGAFINKEKHLILEAPHPSPLSAHRGFLGCGHFKKANDYLTLHEKEAINWQV